MSSIKVKLIQEKSRGEIIEWRPKDRLLAVYSPAHLVFRAESDPGFSLFITNKPEERDAVWDMFCLDDGGDYRWRPEGHPEKEWKDKVLSREMDIDVDEGYVGNSYWLQATYESMKDEMAHHHDPKKSKEYYHFGRSVYGPFPFSKGEYQDILQANQLEYEQKLEKTRRTKEQAFGRLERGEITQDYYDWVIEQCKYRETRLREKKEFLDKNIIDPKIHTYYNPKNTFHQNPYSGVKIEVYRKLKILKAEWRDVDETPLGDTEKAYGQWVQIYIETEGFEQGEALQLSIWDDDYISYDDKIDGNYTLHVGKDGIIKAYIQIEPKWQAKAIGKVLSAPQNFMGINMVKAKLCILLSHPQLYRKYDTDWLGEISRDLPFYAKHLTVKNEMIIEQAPDVEQTNQIYYIDDGEVQMSAGFEFCHYTQIQAKVPEQKTPAILFQEKGGLVTPTVDGFSMTAGPRKEDWHIVHHKLSNLETRDLTTALTLDLVTKAATCPDIYTPLMGKEHKNNVFQLADLPDEVEVKEITLDHKVVLSVAHRPPKDGKEATKWFFGDQHYSFNVPVNTCRYQNKVPITVYPELEYSFNFKIQADESLYMLQGEKYQNPLHLNSTYTYRKGAEIILDQTRRSEAKQQEEKKKKYKNKKKLKLADKLKFQSFGCSFDASYRGETLYGLEVEGNHELFNVFNTVMYMLNMLDRLSFGSEAEAAEAELKKTNSKAVKQRTASKTKNKGKLNHALKSKTAKKALKKITKSPVRIDVDGPSFVGGVSFVKEVSQTQPGEIGTRYKAVFKAAPLVEITGRLDLLMFAGKLPYVGPFIEAVMILTDVADWVFGDNLDIDYYFDLYVTGRCNVEAAEVVTYHTLDGWGDGGEIKVTGEFEFGLQAGVTLELEIVDKKRVLDLQAKGFAKFTVEKEGDTLTTNFDGLYASVFVRYRAEDERERVKGDKPEETPKPKETVQLFEGFGGEIKLS
ncbi:MAG: hypothetical protein ACK5IC_04485 [Moheibacter sp.]